MLETLQRLLITSRTELLGCSPIWPLISSPAPLPPRPGEMTRTPPLRKSSLRLCKYPRCPRKAQAMAGFPAFVHVVLLARSALSARLHCLTNFFSFNIQLKYHFL